MRTTRPDKAWHVDVTLVKLLDGTKLYLHGVIDNFSKRILSWKLSPKLQAVSSVAVLTDGIRSSIAKDLLPTAVVDGGSENFNSKVDEIIDQGLLRRQLAQTDIRFSNSPIEAFWKSLKNQWLYLNTLDSEAAVKKLVTFFVNEHNTTIPHSAFNGQTPDEMYFGKGENVPGELAAARAKARQARLEANRSLSCDDCARSTSGTVAVEAAAA